MQNGFKKKHAAFLNIPVISHRYCLDREALQTHQEYPFQLILDVLHTRKGCHSLDHLNENAANSPGRQ